MKRNLIIKALVLMLVLTCILPVVLACKKQEQTGDDTGTDVVSTDESIETEARYDENGYLMDDLPELDFGGKEIRVLSWGDYKGSEYDNADKTGDAADNLSLAIYMRDTKFQRRLNVKMAYRYANGKSDEFLVAADAAEVEGGLDLYAMYSPTAISMTLRGYTQDLLKQNYLNFDKPWWNSSLTDNLLIYDRLYFATGDISPNLFIQSAIMYFNKDMAKIYVDGGVDTIYNAVRNGEWTIDKMMEFSKNVGSSADDKKDASDTFGFAAVSGCASPLYYGGGYKIIDTAPDGSLVMSDDIKSGRGITYAEKLLDFFKTGDAGVPSLGEEEYSTDAWNAGRALFTQSIAIHASNYAQKGLNFGILPMPKSSATDQDSYVSFVGNPYTMWAISRNSDDVEIAAAIMECMASESYRIVAPALYDKHLRLQTAQSADDFDMWGYIKDAVTVDPAQVLDDASSGEFTFNIFYRAMREPTLYMSIYQKYVMESEKKVITLNSSMKVIESVYGQ